MIVADNKSVDVLHTKRVIEKSGNSKKILLIHKENFSKKFNDQSHPCLRMKLTDLAALKASRRLSAPPTTIPKNIVKREFVSDTRVGLVKRRGNPTSGLFSNNSKLKNKELKKTLQ